MSTKTKRRIGGLLAGTMLACIGCSAEVAMAACEKDQGWDLDCVASAYAKPRNQWPKPDVDTGIAWKELGLVPPPKEGNQRVVALGEKLFNDPRLSQSNEISCASCHQPSKGYSNGAAVAVGHQGAKGNRNSPTLWNLDSAEKLFWDGRADSLEEQALGPVANPVEMAMPLAELMVKLQGLNEYKEAFARAFGPGKISLTRFSKALATYERTLRSPETRFDQFLKGDENALSTQELLGLHLFRTKARCLNCHYGERMTDNEFHNLGLTYFDRKYEDLGRYGVTGKKEDVGRFKTPGLRGVSGSGPWMHNGLFPQLSGILNMYNAGMPTSGPVDEAQALNPLFPVRSPLIKPLKLNREELDALLAFLNVL